MSVQGPAGPAGPAGTAGALTSRSQVYTVKSAVTAVNYTSVNNTFVWHATTPRHPFVSDTDLAVLEGNKELPQFSPIFQINYADGVVQGQGYVESWILAPADVSGSKLVRERFTVSGASCAASAVSVRVNRGSGSSPLTVTVATLDGTTLSQSNVAASNFPPQPLAGDTRANQPVWGSGQFSSPVTLAAGQSYQLRISTAADTHYQVYGIHKGTIYKFQPPTFFGDGYAQYSTDNGVHWNGFNQPGGAANNLDADLQFFFPCQ